MTAVLVAVALTATGFGGVWVGRRSNRPAIIRADNAHYTAIAADVYRETNERLYDEKAALEAAVTPELTCLRDEYLPMRELVVRGKATT